MDGASRKQAPHTVAVHQQLEEAHQLQRFGRDARAHVDHRARRAASEAAVADTDSGTGRAERLAVHPHLQPEARPPTQQRVARHGLPGHERLKYPWQRTANLRPADSVRLPLVR